MAVPDIGAKRGIKALVTCPKCGGRGVEVGPLLQLWQGKCELCHGMGKISLVACLCGRTKRLDAVGFVEPGIYSCGLEECKRLLKPKIMAVAYALPYHEVKALAGKDDTEARGMWMDYMGQDVYD